MQFTTLTLCALSIASAIAQTVHVVTVGGSNGTKEFSPSNIVAAVGDMVQFQFNPANHTVTQSTFDQPCQPISQFSNTTGVFSGFNAVAAGDTNRPTFTIPITSTTPMWLYCSQAGHCAAGMVAVINENTAANATRSLQNYALGAKTAPTNNLVPNVAASTGGTSGTTGSNSTSSFGSSSSSGSGSSGSSGSSASSSSTAGTAQQTTASSATKFSASTLLGLSIAIAFVAFA